MHDRATFTEAVNRGIKEALEHRATYVLVINNDVEFLTPVATQLTKHAENESNLGLIAPRQIVVRDHKNRHDIKRGCWLLTKLDFSHETDDTEGHPELLEADFCEFTCVLIKSVVFQKVGLLNEKYQFYHEDVDFSFRCQVAGFRCVYDQTALIKHYYGATFEKQKTYNKRDLIRRNKDYFSADHLRYHVRFPFIPSTDSCSWSNTNEFLSIYLNKYGLLDFNPDSPTLSTIAHPEMVQSDYLLTVWETSKLPRSWLTDSKKFKHIFVPSSWNKQVFEQSGFTNVSLFPFGVETDIFNPWGSKLSFPWSRSILCVFQNQYRKALDVTLQMWNQVRTKHPDVFLVMYVKKIDSSKLGMSDCFTLRMGNFLAKIDRNRQIALLQPAFKEAVSHADMATLYRSCAMYLLNSRSEGFGYPILEAMACGSMCVIPNYGATKEFIQERNCIFFEGMPIQANYEDKGFEDVGTWWEPDLKDLCSKVDHALHLDLPTITAIGNRARQHVLSHYTWRRSVMVLRKNLEQLQPVSIHKTIQTCSVCGFKKKSVSNKRRKQVASLMNSVGRNFIKVGATLELYGLKEIIKKIKSKIIKHCLKRFSKHTQET
jgi:glycosyltransferase involved in cell wall biosynthesis